MKKEWQGTAWKNTILFFLTVNDVLMFEKGYVWTPFAVQWKGIVAKKGSVGSEEDEESVAEYEVTLQILAINLVSNTTQWVWNLRYKRVERRFIRKERFSREKNVFKKKEEE